MAEAEAMRGEPDDSGGVGKAMASRLAAVESAAKTWADQLVDLTGRNNLLYFRDLKVGTLPLDNASEALLYQALQGKTVSLSRLFPDPEDLRDAVKRARAVHNKSKANYEERGLETLYLGCGFATWSSQKPAATPAAPILLVPIRLSPKGAAQEEFEVAVTAELEVNPTFLQMLKAEFSVDCDPSSLLAHSGIEGIIDTPEELETSYEWLRSQCRSVPGFGVNSRFVIGNFSYARMPMVRDLEGSTEAMAEHDIVAALAGDAEAQAVLRQAGASEPIPAPDQLPPADEFLVLDADASQNYAINAVLAGRNLIVKGPPGTGKSQTISNLVSTLVARGKRVLFVAEKRAAIDAVLKRLNAVGLGDLVLDLHGGVTSRRETARALSSVLDTNARLVKPNLSNLHHRLAVNREKLNRRVEGLHQRRDPWGLSFFEVESRLMKLPEAAVTDVRFDAEQLQRMSEETIRQASEDLQRFVGLGGLTLRQSGSPWAHASVESQEEAQALREEVQDLRKGLPLLLSQLRAAATEVALTGADSLPGWGDRIALWQEIRELRHNFTDSIFELDLDAIIEGIEAAAGSVGRRASAAMFSSEYRAARKTLRACLPEGRTMPPRALYLGAVDARTLRDVWHSLGGTGSPRDPTQLDGLAQGFDSLQSRLDALASRLGRAPFASDEQAACQELDALLADIPTLSKLPELQQLEKGLREIGLGDLLAQMEGQPLGSPQAAERLDFALMRSLAEYLQLADPLLGAFDGEQHLQVVHDYQLADREHIETSAWRVRRICAEQAVAAQDAHPDDAALVRAEAGKKRRHLPIRNLFAAAPEVLTSLKPCWAMSPLVVSQILPSDEPHFDVVVFDEASQVRPADAIPAILRGKQLVVAGDERQLPPTSFFAGANLDAEEEAEVEARLSVDSSFESILEGLQGFVDFRMLKWHYRSRDERLITFSNVYLYDRGLTTFPGVVGPDCVSLELIPFAPGQPGSEASSPAEVERVVELILEHAERRPEQSLGVIAMGINHANRIEARLREVLGEQDGGGLDEFFSESRPEPFFVKNLERVQGDERDAIILSVGYGKSPDGRLLYRFGPLNQEGGERRLNVAVTRAKERITLVSSFSHADMDPGRSSARGVQLLRAYLEYCASHGSELGQAAREIPELNPFEVDIRDNLERAGIPLIAQFGSSGYRIDFAAKHPTKPGRMVLAIECDGASYHSSESARDRDRLRQEHLERLGWKFHRIWSQDWFNDKVREIARAQTAYREGVEAADRADEAGRPVADAQAPPYDSGKRPSPSATGGTEVEVPHRGPCPVRPHRGTIDDYRPAELVQLIRWIESDTLPRTRDEVLAEAIKQLGFRRRGKKIVAALERAIATARG